MSWNENYSKKMKVLQKNTKETLLKKPATAGSLLSQSYPAAHWVFEGACQIAKWENNEKTPENTSPFEKGTECIQDPKFNETKTVKTSKPKPFSPLDHPIGKPRCPMPVRSRGFSLSKSRLVQLGGLNFSCRVPPKLPLHSFILHIPSLPGFFGLQCNVQYSA